MSIMKNPETPLTPEQRAAMASELADLRLRAEHGLLKRLVVEASAGPSAAAAEIGQALGGLTSLLAIRSP